MRDPLLNSNAALELFNSGYVVLPMLGPEETEELAERFSTLRPDDRFAPACDEGGRTYHCTFLDKSALYRRAANELVRQVFSPHLDRHLDGYRILTSNLYVKPPGSGKIEIHQNWPTQSDPARTTLTVWCPLQDTDLVNGTLHVVPGSHKIVPDIATPLDPPFFRDFENELIDRFLIPVDVRAGDAVVFDDSLLHWSPENRSEKPRWAIQLILVPKEYNPVIYYFDGSTSPRAWELYAVDCDFFIENSIDAVLTRPTELQLIERVPARNRPIDLVEFQELLSRGQAIREHVRDTGDWPSTSPSCCPRSPGYVARLIADFNDGTSSRFLHLGHWDQPASAVEDRVAAEARLNDVVLGLTRVQNGTTLVDVGCGLGGTLDVINSRYKGMNLIGVDVGLAGLEICGQLRHERGNALSFLQGDATAMPLADASVDAIISIEAMLHMPSRRAFLSECGRMLVDGGILTVVDIYLAADAADSLGMSLQELRNTLDPVFGPWPELGANIGTTLRLAEDLGLTAETTIDATENTKPTYYRRPSDPHRRAASTLNEEQAVQSFVELHLDDRVQIIYQTLRRDPR